jgi:DNA invertase Pin-like site-specific DNA recombinase
MKYGYARTSTTKQDYGLEDQVEKLQAYGCGVIRKEQVSSVAERPEFETILDFIQEDDALVVTTLSRFARSIKDLWISVELLEKKGASLVVLDMSLDTGTPNGRLMITLIGAINQWEREILLERQKIGIAKAKEEGKYKGRADTARRKANQIRHLHEQGMKPSAIAKELNIGVASVYRYRQDTKIVSAQQLMPTGQEN